MMTTHRGVVRMVPQQAAHLPIIVCVLFAAGCSTSYRVEGVFTRPTLGSYQRIAVSGLQSEQEQILMSEFARAFRDQQVVFVERARIRELFSEQDLLPDRLDSTMRDRLRKVSSVQGIIFGTYRDSHEKTEKGKPLVVQDFGLRILDVETGEIVGSALVHAESTNGVLLRTLASKAVSAVRSSLRRHQPQEMRIVPPPREAQQVGLP